VNSCTPEGLALPAKHVTPAPVTIISDRIYNEYYNPKRQSM